MRKTLLMAMAVLMISASACAPASEEADGGASPTPTTDGMQTAAECLESNADSLFMAGTLTIATGNPAYAPWYGGDETAAGGGEWKAKSYTGDPYSGEGYESAFAYALAEQMGLSTDQVKWLGIPFGKSFAPGAKDFDFAMQQISITEKRAEAVDFSVGYFAVNQALIANEGSPAIGATTLEELKDLKLGAPVGTTSLAVIQELVQPNVEPGVYDDLDTAIKDLNNGQLDGVVVDFPTAFYGYADVVVGQFANIGAQEEFGLAFEKGNQLRSCVDLGIEELRSAGTLDALKSEWLEVDTSVPTFS